MIVNSLESHSLTPLKKNTEVLFLSFDKESCLKINPYFYESIAIVDYSVGFAQLRESQEKITKSIVALLKSIPPDDLAGGIDKIRLQIMYERMSSLLNLLSTVYRPRISKGGVLVAAPEEKINMLYRMISYLYENYNKNPSLDDFLKREHYSLYHMSHVIAEITGTSFRDWLTYVRVEQSEKILLATDLPISGVAYEVGFSSVRYYNTNFKKWYGITPADFRRLFKHNYDHGVEPPSDDLIMARNFLYDYLDHRADSPLHHGSSCKQKDDDTGTLYIEMKPNSNSKDMKTYPRQECVINFSELSHSDRWEHLLWAQNEIGFSMLRILTHSKSPASKLPENEINLIKQFSAYVRKNHRSDSEQRNLKISVETAGSASSQNHKPFELLNPCLPLDSLVTVEGRKTPEFFFYSLLSQFKHKKVSDMPWSIVSKSEEQIFVFLVRREAFSLDHKLEKVKICINGVCGNYKLTTYKCDLDFLYNDAPVKDVNLLNHLTPSDYKCLNMMYEPRVSFELLSFQNYGEITSRLMNNSCQLLVLTPVCL